VVGGRFPKDSRRHHTGDTPIMVTFWLVAKFAYVADTAGDCLAAVRVTVEATHEGALNNVGAENSVGKLS
jgi:hypothetical protein